MDRAQQVLAEEEGKRLRIVERITEYDRTIAQAFAQQQDTLKTPVFDPVRASSFSGYVWRMKQLRAQEHQALQQQEKTVLEARKALQEALIKKKSLEILKDKEHKRYLKHIDKQDEDFLAELALNRHTRKQQQ